MKSIAQFVNEGISDPGDLDDALQTAMRLEFSTIPPYLCAQWSTKNDPSGVGSLIRGVAVQEMYHFALAGNILSAIGGSPRIANPGFLPTYPTNTLPGGIYQKLAVDLQPLSSAQLDVFMQIENPQFDPVVIHPPGPELLEAVHAPPTIGDFYDTIIKALQDHPPPIDQNAKYVAYGEAVQITSTDQAIQIIGQITDEGEGTPSSPSQGPSGPGRLAHFYVFQMIKLGKRYVLQNGAWVIDPNATIQMPDTWTFQPGDSTDFSKMVTNLLVSLEKNWKDGSDPDTDAMDNLEAAGIKLIQQGIRPEFRWVV